MKQLCLLGVVILLLSSCSNNYEKVIGDFVQTDKDGTFTDLQFKLLDVLDTSDFTVADSLNILKKDIDDYHKLVERSKRPFSFILPTDLARARRKLEKVKYMDSIYTNYREKDEVLAKLIKCRFSMVMPFFNVRQEQTKTFIFTPNKKKCIGVIGKLW